MNISQNDINILSQPYSTRYIKLYLLDFNYRTIDEISGNALSCNVTIDANSDCRRSCDVQIIVNDSTFDIASQQAVWLNRYIKPYVGIENILTGEIQWYNQGIYLINAPSWSFDATTHTLGFNGLDLMSKLTGTRNGYLPGVPTLIPSGSSVRDSMIATIALGGFTQYIIDECKQADGTIQNVPYDIEIAQGGTIYDVLTELVNIMPNYQIYFDENGVFHYHEIPSGDDEPVLIDDTLLKKLVISENVNRDLGYIKNYIEVYGRSHNVQYYATSTSVSGSVVSLTFAELPQNPVDVIFGFTLDSNVSGNIKINSNQTGAFPLVDMYGHQITSLSKDVYYVTTPKINESNDIEILFLGHQQAYAYAEDDNPNSPFYTGGEAGIIRQVLYGGDYDNIMSDELCLQRAKLEIYWKCRLNDSITLNTIPIPWIDVNVIISHSILNEELSNKYMIKSISTNYGDVNATMTINAITYYPYYNE